MGPKTWAEGPSGARRRGQASPAGSCPRSSGHQAPARSITPPQSQDEPRAGGCGIRVACMSQGLRMVHLRTVPDAWQAQVLAARLGSEGIVTHLEGNLAGPYPFGAVSVLVEAGQADLAAELLLADEVEAAFAGPRGREPVGRPDGEVSPEELLAFSSDEPADARAHLKPWAKRRRRALAAVAALALAGGPLLAHFIGQ